VRDALGGMNPGGRDVVELSLVHGLDGDELAAALRVSRNHAHALQSRARGQLERSLGALLVVRTGRDSCPDLDGMLDGWDRRLTVLMRKRISRHIEQCQTCGERKRHELSPAPLAGASPLVALAPWFREHVLRMCADATPRWGSTAGRRGGPRGPVRPGRIPRAGPPPGVRGWHQLIHHSPVLTASAAAAAAAAGVCAVLVIGGGAAQSPAAGARGSAGPGGSRTAGALRPGRAGGPYSRAAGVFAPGLGAHPALQAAGGVPNAAPSTPGSSPSGRAAAAAASAAASASAPPVVHGTLTTSLSRLVLVAVHGHGVGTFALSASGAPPMPRHPPSRCLVRTSRPAGPEASR
jgi:hypothetical protein